MKLTAIATMCTTVHAPEPSTTDVACINKKNKMLSYRRETALHDALQFSPKVEDWNWETIFYGHYRSIFNHCHIIGPKICRIQ